MAKRKNGNDDLDQNKPDPEDDSSDNFGLPDIEYKPLDRTEIVVTETTETHTESVEPGEHVVSEEPVAEIGSDEPPHPPVDYLEEEEEPNSIVPVVIWSVIILVVVAAGFLAWKYVYVPRVEKQKMELAKKENDARLKKEEDARIAKEKEAAEQKRLADEAAAKAIPPVGSIETLSDRTNRFYVVLASDIDGDLIMDFAKRLSAKGVSTKIVPPFGTTKFSRLTMGDYDSYASAQSGADAAKADFGPNLWVMKY